MSEGGGAGAADPRTTVVITKLLVVTCSPSVDPDATLEEEAQAYRRLADEANQAAAAAAADGGRVQRRVELVVERQATARRFVELVDEHTGEVAAAAAVEGAAAAGATNARFECVVVLSGHGDAMLRGAPTFGFISEAVEPGTLDVVDPAALVLALEGARAEWRERRLGRLRLVLLNGCLTAATARALASAGVADTVGWETRALCSVAGPLFGPELVREVAVRGAPVEAALATAKSRVLMHTTAGVLDPASRSHPAGVPLYAFHDPHDWLTVSGDHKLLNDGPCPRLAVGVPMLASKVASDATKATVLDQLHPLAAQMDSSELAAEAAALKKKREKDAKKARRLDMERRVDFLMYGASSSSSSSSSSGPAQFTAEEEAWITKKVAKRTAQRHAQELTADAYRSQEELDATFSARVTPPHPCPQEEKRDEERKS
jgi:hypothetical protein